MKVLVIGESARDVFKYNSCTRIAPEGPVAVLQPVRETSNPGMAGNVKRNLENLGAQVDIITNDNWEEITKTRLVDETTNHLFCRIDEKDNDYGWIGHCSRFITTCDWVDQIGWNEYDAVVISDYNKSFLTYKDIQDVASKHSNVFIDTKKIITGHFFDKSRFIKINANEYHKSEPHLNEDIKPKFIITSGKFGATHKNEHFPVKEVTIKDVSGAGDTFLAGLVFKFVETNDIKQAIKFANECATMVVQHRGVTIV